MLTSCCHYTVSDILLSRFAPEVWPRYCGGFVYFNGVAGSQWPSPSDKRFHLSSDDAQAALRILTPGRMERILALADSSFGKFAVNLDRDGRLYIAVHSGRGFFDIGKARENQAQLRQRFARKLRWFTDMIDVFRSV